MQQPQQFNIADYELKDNEITVTTERYSIHIPVFIPVDKFEWWLKINDRLQWEIKGSGQNITGNMSLAEYWATDPAHIKQDIYGYISTNPIVTAEGDFFSNGLDSLLLAFDRHNAARINPVFNTRLNS